MTDLELYTAAKEAYYAGSPIMEDFEFDALEKSLGLENKAYVGSHHNPSYTIKHPFVMGSLSKVQIHEKDGVIDWEGYLTKIDKYVKQQPSAECIITPKYDGCSFEAHITPQGITISTRGDGDYGRDISSHIYTQVMRNVDVIGPQIAEDEYVLRGEVLIDKTVFAEKYSDFVNPRSFVAGVLNSDIDLSDDTAVSRCNDLSIVIYDIRYMHEGNWEDAEWTLFTYPDRPQFYFTSMKLADASALETIYHSFEDYRNDDCPYALDGIVIKPMAFWRVNELTSARPTDCAAVKFIPQLQETVVEHIEWSTKKTDELNPVIITRPVMMDGKVITRASAHNYGYLIANKISVGTKVILSLAGDIIPFIYKVTDTSAFDENNLCINHTSYVDGCHLRKIMSDEELCEQRFMTSASQLNIPSIGPAAAKTIYEYVKDHSAADDFFGTDATEVPDNILLVNAVDIENSLGGKSGKNAKKAFIEFISTLRLRDIILSCGFEFCGSKVAEKIEENMLYGSADFSSMAREGYEWALEDSYKMNQVRHIMDTLHKDEDDFRTVSVSAAPSADTIPVILTGEPNDYATKSEFLKCHPEYRLTTSWKEVQIVFTNSMDSTTGKMKKAKEKNIEIRLY